MLHTTPPTPAALARRPDPAGPLAVATPTTRKLADASLSVNTRRAYAGALRQFDTWRGAAPATDATLAAYLGFLFEQGRAPATAALVVAAVTFRATLAGTPVRGPQTDRVLAGFRRARVARRGAGHHRGRDPRHRASLENRPGGDRRRRALSQERRRRSRTPQQLGRRFTAAAAGLPGRLTAHSGRVGLASELTARGASTTDVMLAGAWKTARMVAHYSAGATAELGAVASRWGGDARGTGPPDPAGLRHPRLSVRGRTGRGAAAQEPRAVIGQAVWSSAPRYLADRGPAVPRGVGSLSRHPHHGV